MKKSEYPDWLIPLELAKELEKIGFDEPCYFKYDSEGVFFSDYVNATEKGEFLSCIYIDLNKGFGNIPTWEQALSWFRKKGLVGTIEYEDFILDDKTCYYAYRITDKSGDILFYSSNYKTYETYEETREALINKLIELYGRK
jgi:hypothetical protein